MKFLKRSLMAKLMFYFFLFSLIPTSIISYVAYENGRSALEEETTNKLTIARTQKEGEINTWISEKKKSLLLISKPKDISQNIILLKNYDRNHPISMRVQRDLTDHFGSIVTQESDFHEIFLLDAENGEVIFSTTNKNLGKDESEKNYFIKGKEGAYIGEVQLSLELGRPVITIATPINNGNEELIGVLSGRFNLNKLDKIMGERTGLGETGETYLINKYYRYASDPRFVGGILLKKEIHTKGIDDCPIKKKGVGLYNNYDSVPVIGTYKWMEETQLCILAEITQVEAFEPITKFRRIVLTMVLIIAFFLILPVVFISHNLIYPLNQLVEGTEKIGEGDLHYKINIKSKDEVGRLAKSFNKMTQNLEEFQKHVVQSEKLASLGRLAAGLAHDINSPLTNISTSTQILKRDLDKDDPKLERLDIIEENIDAVTKITRNLLEYARPPKLRFEDVDVNELLKMSLKMLKYQISNIKVLLYFSRDLPLTQGDSGQLQQVFINLITNAYQAMPNGGELKITTWNAVDFIEIDITDTGQGIAKEDINKIFDPFFTTRETGGGTGLGLSISQGIIEKHNGRIEVKSEIGEGTTITIKLPVA